ncbi:protein Mpv17 [Sporothrix schenckii 1099-18]|uniref:Protein Mpv17 n=1 Tax=Sporothrix schenckii 1099-18 TaxID=1397361 RepID=A0A0F2MLU9_SPOSC|nr:protein Mpv17 [Sporothrix schenckii 1099-18]KJR90009.1 protein Mpv17 [Sporothrix schenckii 1099-18]
MSWDLLSRRIARAANSKFIYGQIPLLHSIIFLIEMALAARLTARFNAYYEERPVLTMMVTNAVLGGIADTVAQTITSMKQRQLRKGYAAKDDDDVALGRYPSYRDRDDANKDDSVVVEIHELAGGRTPNSTGNGIGSVSSAASSAHSSRNSSPDNTIGSNNTIVPASKMLPPPFDFERLTRFMAYGFGMAPIQFKWFQFLSRTFPITKTASALGATLKRVAMDQLVFAPVGIAWFFTVMTVTEGGGRHSVQIKLRDMFVPTLKANFMVWPAVQLINFRLMPVQFQLPFVSTVGIAWTAYLSLTNAAEDVQQVKAHVPDAPRIRLE